MAKSISLEDKKAFKNGVFDSGCKFSQFSSQLLLNIIHSCLLYKVWQILM
jgi:hypothetical protein